MGQKTRLDGAAAVFLMFYRAVYLTLALFMSVSEYRKDGNILGALAFAVFIAVALELMYWVRQFGTDFPDRFRIWMTHQRERVAEDPLYPNLPLFVALMMAFLCIGIATAAHLTFPETCDPESRKWLYRVAICKQPFRSIFYLSSTVLFAMVGAGSLVMAFMLRRRYRSSSDRDSRDL